MRRVRAARDGDVRRRAARVARARIRGDDVVRRALDSRGTGRFHARVSGVLQRNRHRGVARVHVLRRRGVAQASARRHRPRARRQGKGRNRAQSRAVDARASSRRTGGRRTRARRTGR